MQVGVSQLMVVTPVPSRRPVCICGGGWGKVHVLIRGGLFQCTTNLVGRSWPGGRDWWDRSQQRS